MGSLTVLTEVTPEESTMLRRIVDRHLSYHPTRRTRRYCWDADKSFSYSANESEVEAIEALRDKRIVELIERPEFFQVVPTELGMVLHRQSHGRNSQVSSVTLIQIDNAMQLVRSALAPLVGSDSRQIRDELQNALRALETTLQLIGRKG